jgi:hypothetical protein
MPRPSSRISVVIPTTGRNLPALQRAIRSVYRGALYPAKTVVALDAAATIERRVLEKVLVGRWPKLVVVRSERHGNAAATYNAGLAEVETEWVDFLDDDDEWLLGRLEAITGLLGETDADVIFAGSLAYHDELERLESFDSRGFRSGSFPVHEGALHTGWARDGRVFGRSSGGAYRVSLLRCLGGFDEGLAFGEWTDLYRRLPPGTNAISLPGAWKMKDRTFHPSFSGNSDARGHAVAAFLAGAEPRDKAWAAVLMANRSRPESSAFESGMPTCFLPLCIDGSLRATTQLEAAYSGCLGAGAEIIAVIHENHPAFIPIYQDSPSKSVWRDAFLNRGDAECAALGIELLGQIGLLRDLEGVLLHTLAAWLPQSSWAALMEEVLANRHDPAVVVGANDKLDSQTHGGALYWIPRRNFIDLVRSPVDWSLGRFVQANAQHGNSWRRIRANGLKSCETWPSWSDVCSFAIRELIVDRDPLSRVPLASPTDPGVGGHRE